MDKVYVIDGPQKGDSFALTKKSITIGFTTEFTGSGGSSGSMFGRPIQLSLQSSGSLEELEKASEQVLNVIEDIPGLVDLNRSTKPGKLGINIQVDRERAADLELSAVNIGSTTRMLIHGEVASQFKEGDEDIDVRVGLRPEDRDRYSDILSLPIISSNDIVVPLASVSTISMVDEPARIERLDKQRQIVIGADFTDRPQGDIVNDIKDRIKDITLPQGITTKFIGQTEMMTESFDTLFFTMFLSVIFMYMVLASQFGSFLQPLIVMLALPFSIIGAIGALMVTRNPLDIMAMMGVILLMGIVTKNSILLVDFTNQERAKGIPIREALLNAGTTRLRPVLMTTLALILGMLPVAIGLGAGGEFRSPMAIAVIGGLITSTFLTLVVVPVVYSLLQRTK